MSGGFGGGILSQDIQQAFDSLGEQSGACDAVDEHKMAVLLVDVLKGLGGASQERSAARTLKPI